ncbi:MAG: Abi family protein [Bacteroidales bacterium]|jgi:abortive infection bacteriophage resistance protein|nr:Abi family protein [Bacteroidales bacterium]
MANKDSRTIAEQIALLKSRGMLMKDEQEAAFYLSHISYYRLKGYWWDMQIDRITHIFAPNSHFEDVIARYHFDRQLRLILFDAIEFIEITLRTKLIYHLSQAYGGLWYLNEMLFENGTLHAKHIENLRNEFAISGEIFAKDFRTKHPTESTNPKIWVSSENPDVWLIFETATFGVLSKIYKNLKHQSPQKSIIANEFGLNLHSELSSWLETVSYLRNIVAHHSRVWSRSMVKRITLPKTTRNLWLKPTTISIQESTQRPKPFLVISTMIYLCNAINPNNEIKDKLLALFNSNPNIPIYKLGFFNNWQNEPLWK